MGEKIFNGKSLGEEEFPLWYCNVNKQQSEIARGYTHDTFYFRLDQCLMPDVKHEFWSEIFTEYSSIYLNNIHYRIKWSDTEENYTEKWIYFEWTFFF